MPDEAPSAVRHAAGDAIDLLRLPVDHDVLADFLAGFGGRRRRGLGTRGLGRSALRRSGLLAFGPGGRSGGYRTIGRRLVRVGTASQKQAEAHQSHTAGNPHRHRRYEALTSLAV
jgi:hypothetical protein